MSNTYSTGNPIGSTSPKDLYDNSSNFDEGLNSTSPSFTDRLGKRRQTWQGMQAAVNNFLVSSGYQVIGEYAAGLTLALRNQVVRYQGNYYKAAAATDLPYVLSGVWATDGPKLTLVGDSSLRQDLLAGGQLLVDSSAVSVSGVALNTWLANGALNAKNNGCKGDGTTDDTAMVLAVINAAVAAQCPAYFPAGNYICSAPVAKALTGLQKLAILGDGSNLTQFTFTGGGDGFSFTSPTGNWWLEIAPSNGFQFSGFSVVTTSNNVGTGLKINGGSIEGRPAPKISFTDVTWRGKNSFNQSWAVSTDLEDATEGWFTNCRWIMGGPGNRNGIGVHLHATGDTTDPTAFSFLHCEALYGNFWIRPGDYVEGIYLTQCSHVGGNVAVYWTAASESGLHVIGGHYNNCVFNFYLDGVFHWIIEGALLFASKAAITDVWYGIYAVNGNEFTIANNVIRGEGTGTEVLIHVDQTAGGDDRGSVINGNQLSNYANIGISLGATSRNVTVGVNGFNSAISGSAEIINAGSSNRVARRKYSDTRVITLPTTTTASVAVSIPAGILKSKPKTAIIQGAGNTIMGFYDYDNVGNGPTQIIVLFRDLTGGALPGGGVRFSVVLEE